jgi:aminomethyltransferase
MALEGFALKNDFGDARAEATACRADCALFDFSFLECARLSGRRAASVVEAFAGRPVQALPERGILYALRVGPAGEAVADLTVWRTGPESFEIMSGRRQDVVDLLADAGTGVEVDDVGAERAVLAVQGPRTCDALRRLGDVAGIARLDYFRFCHADLAGISCAVGRLGYSGEAGVEIIVARSRATELWDALSAHARPAGFAAVDMLRIEAGFVLFTNEFCFAVSPTEAGLERFHRHGGPRDPAIKLVSFRADADLRSWPWRPARDPQRPVTPGTIVVTSACDSVVAGGILGLGYVPAGTEARAAVDDPTGTFRNARLVPMPFYGSAKTRARAIWR